MEIYLIRHTTPDIEKGICYGQTDVPLLADHKLEIKDVLSQLPSAIDKVYSSPLQRCSMLASHVNKDYIIDSRLKELNFGDWEMQKWNDIPSQDIQPWYDDYVNTPCLNGESYQQLYTRVVAFYHELKTQSYQSIAVVTHGGVIRCLLAHFKNIPLSQSFARIKNMPWGGVERMEV